MTPAFHACLANALRAERAGDLAAALEWHQSVPLFAKGRHVSMLRQLAGDQRDLPAWVWARLAVYLSTRIEDGSAGRLNRATLRDVIEGFHGDLLAECHDGGGDPVRVSAGVMGESWVFHQRCAYDEGGVVAFLDEFASGRLAETADLARRWADTPVGGYRLGESRPGATMVATDLATGAEITLLDLGAGLVDPGGTVLGRLVPSGPGGLLMFDMPPLGVPEPLAVQVARSSGSAWWQLIDDDLVRAGLSSSMVMREDYELVTDIEGLDLLALGTRPAEHERVLSQLRSGRDEISRAAYRILARAASGDLPPAQQALVAAAVMQPRACSDIARVRNASPVVSWEEWAERCPEPARSRLRRLDGLRP